MSLSERSTGAVVAYGLATVVVCAFACIGAASFASEENEADHLILPSNGSGSVAYALDAHLPQSASNLTRLKISAARQRGNAVGCLFYQLGDVFAAVSDGRVQQYDPVGNLIDTLLTGVPGFNTGMAFDSDGILYVTNFQGNSVSRVDGPFCPHNSLGVIANDMTVPESIVFDGVGNFYVTSVRNVTRGTVFKYAPNGALLDTFDINETVGRPTTAGVDWIDLAADQRTLFWTSEGTFVGRYDLQTETLLPDFNNAPLPGTQAYAIRILPDGTVILADRELVVRFDANGDVLQTYDVDGEDTWFAMNLDPDKMSFWSGNFQTANFYKFDIATGNVLIGPINTGTGDLTLFGLTVFGEVTVGTETDCSNKIDDDRDGLIDCEDPDCAFDPACGEIICPDDPNDFLKAFGSTVTGDALDLCDSDDLRLQVLEIGQVSPLLPFIRLEFWAHSSFDTNITAVEYMIECHVSAAVAGGQNSDTLRTYVRNYDTAMFELVDQRGTPPGTDVVIEHLQVIDAENYVQSGDGEVRVRQDVFSPGDVFSPLWFLKVDLYEVAIAKAV